MIMNNNSEPFNTLINSSMIMNNSNELFNARINSSLNDSTTKQAYSFGREVRFKNSSKKDNLYHFYDLPQIRSNRSTTLGYGKRLNSSAIIGCGSNKLYVLPNYFDPKNHNSPGYTFGVSRPTKKRQERSPGPIYNVRKKFGDKIPGYVFGTSGMRKKILQRASSVPGPGAYYNEKNHSIGIGYSSKLINSTNIVFGKSKRFADKNKDITPGPGTYNIPGLINDTGVIYNSKYISAPARSFIGKKISDYKFKKIGTNPGPGQYNFFSIFEGYSYNTMK